MDFDLDTDQTALQELTRGFCIDRFPMPVVRAAASGLDRGCWRELAALGAFGIPLPESAGGSGLATVDAVLVFEELGRALVPGPLVASALAAGALDGVIDGEVVVTMAERKPGGPMVVEHLDDADVVVVLDGRQVSIVDAATVPRRAAAEPIDPTTPVALVDELPPATALGGADADRWRRDGSLLTAALLLGIADATTGIAVEYAKARHQFGREIGSFQAMKHLLADMFARVQVARAAVYAAGVVVDEPTAVDVARAVAGARVLAGRTAAENARTCVHVHGGIGYTWEADPHLYLKRAWLHNAQFGSVDAAAELVASRLAVA